MNNEDLSTGARLGYATAGLAIIAAVVFLVSLGLFPSHPGSTYYTAVFGRAGQGMDDESFVKVRGITVGGVVSVKLNKQGKAVVRFRVNPGIRLPAATVATSEPTSVFGPKNLDLDLGPTATTGPYLRSNGTVTHTVDPSELSDTAWPLYKLTRAIDPGELAATVHTFATGLDGEGPALNRGISNGRTLLDSAYDRRTAINQALTDLSRLASTFSTRGPTLVRLAHDLHVVGPVISDRPDLISDLLTGADKLFANGDSTLTHVGGTLGPLADSTSGTVNTLYGRKQDIPTLLNGLTGFFGGLNGIIRVQGPSGSLLGSVENYLALDPCKVLIDVCNPGYGR
jgi:phospholipid/cholesterol/gamma-HCH transport system substrate-binding protein